MSDMNDGDSLASRSDDYERRLAEAGGTEGVLGGLVAGAERNKKTVKWLVVSLALDIVLSLGLGAVAYVAQDSASTADGTAHDACIQGAANSVVINNFLNQLIDNLKTSTLYTPEEQARRIKSYADLLIKIPDCYTDAIADLTQGVG